MRNTEYLVCCRELKEKLAAAQQEKELSESEVGRLQEAVETLQGKVRLCCPPLGDGVVLAGLGGWPYGRKLQRVAALNSGSWVPA